MDNGRDRRRRAPGPERVWTVVVTYQAAETIAATLQSVRDSPASSATVVVDNGSTDGTVELIAAEFPEVTVLQPTDNVGFAAGCNLGIAHAARLGADAYLLLNPDAELDPDCLELLINALTDDPEAGVVSPVLVDPRQDLVWYAGAEFDLDRGRFGVLGWGLHRDAISPIRRTGRPSGATMLIRADALEATGPFEESYFLYWEECEWTARLLAAGYVVALAPAATARHRTSSSTGGTGSPIYEYYFTRNLLRLLVDAGGYDRAGALRRAVPTLWPRVALLLRRDLRQAPRRLQPMAWGIGDFWRGRSGHRAGLP